MSCALVRRRGSRFPDGRGRAMLRSRLYFTIWWAGWFDLARQYPDQGSLKEVPWHHVLCWFNLHGFSAIAAANDVGLRLAIHLTPHAIFIPWNEMTISAKRGWWYT